MLGPRRTRFAPLRTLVGIVLALLGVRRRGAPRARTVSFDRPESTTLGRAFAAAHAGRAPEQGAFGLLADGPGAFLARLDLVRAAERAVDLQYYIYEGDGAGSALACELLRAAERGVRVRILLDDSGIGFRDVVLAELDAHRHVEVRVFNPTAQRGGLARVVEFLTRIGRLNRRMHNKVMTVDGVAAIVGGRNVGDHYFGARRRLSFRDYDVLAFGPAAREAGASFDRFWNSEHAVPVTALAAAELPEARAARLLARLERAAARLMPGATPAPSAAGGLTGLVRGHPLHWAVGRVVSEPPERIADDPAAGVVMATLGAALERAAREVLIESAYFVPQAEGVAALGALTGRGVAVRVLTNALASSDVPAVHAGYAPYRRALLAAGVALHEFRRRPGGRRWRVLRRAVEDETSLHAKVMVIDRRLAWVGSFNMDPRSARLNTEVGVLIASEPFAAELAAQVEADMAPAHAWQVTLEAPTGGGPAGLVWRGTRQGRALRFDAEPEVGYWRRLQQAAFRALPGFEAML